MNDPSIYSTGWYSLSPGFAAWNTDVYRLAALKARREAARTIEKSKQKEITDARKIAKGTISVYA